MLIFGKGLLGETNAQALICPVYDDLIFEMKHTRSLKHLLEERLDFPLHRKELRLRYLDVGEYYHYEFSELSSVPFSSIYYLMVRSFLKKPYFFLLKQSLSSIFLHLLENGKKSVAFPIFGLDCFRIETELEIIREAILAVYEENKNLTQLQIYLLGIPREMFGMATRIFSALPSSIYSGNFRSSRDKRYSYEESY